MSFRRKLKRERHLALWMFVPKQGKEDAPAWENVKSFLQLRIYFSDSLCRQQEPLGLSFGCNCGILFHAVHHFLNRIMVYTPVFAANKKKLLKAI